MKGLIDIKLEPDQAFKDSLFIFDNIANPAVTIQFFRCYIAKTS